MLLRDFTLCAPMAYPRHADFNGEMNCVCNHYLRHVGRFRNEKMRKLIVEAAPNAAALHQIDLDIWQCGVRFDFERYWQKKVADRKRTALDCLHRAVRDVANHFAWDATVFERAYRAVIDDRMDNRFVVGTPRSSSDRRYRAHVLCDFDIDAIRLSIQVQERGAVRASQLIRTTAPHVIFIVDLIGSLRWENRSSVSLIAKDGSVVGTAAVQ